MSTPALHESVPTGAAAEHLAWPAPLAETERCAVRAIVSALRLSLRALTAALGRSHTYWRRVIDGSLAVSADARAGLFDYLRGRIAGELSNVAGAAAAAPAPMAGGTRLLTPLEAATAEVLVALDRASFSEVAARLAISERTLRGWLRRSVAADLEGLARLVTPPACYALYPGLTPPYVGVPRSMRVKASLDAIRRLDRPDFDALLASLREVRGHVETLAGEPEVLGVRLDHLVLDADEVASPPDDWRHLCPESELPPFEVVASDGRRRTIVIQRSKRDWIPLHDDRRHYRRTWVVRASSDPDAPVLASLSFEPKRGRPHVKPLRLMLRGGAFRAGLEHALHALLFAPFAGPGARIASVHVALDVGCSYGRVLEVYRGCGRDFDVRERSAGGGLAPSYRRVGSKRLKLATYDRDAKEVDAQLVDKRRAFEPRPHHRGPTTRIELRLEGELAKRGLATVDLIEALPGLFGEAFGIVDLERALHGAPALEWLALRLIACRGHDRLARPANGVTAPQAMPRRNQVTTRASAQVLRALHEAGCSPSRATRIAQCWHDAATERLEQLATEAPLFDDLGAQVRRRAPALRRQLAQLAGVAQREDDLDALLAAIKRAAAATTPPANVFTSPHSGDDAAQAVQTALEVADDAAAVLDGYEALSRQGRGMCEEGEEVRRAGADARGRDSGG